MKRIILGTVLIAIMNSGYAKGFSFELGIGVNYAGQLLGFTTLPTI